MTARVINDPSALGWEFDPDTGRWTWGGNSGSGGGGGGGSFPEAPVDGKQYGRQNAGWTEIVHSDGGGGTVTTATVQLTNPTAFAPGGLATQEDANTYFAGEVEKIIADAPADSGIYGRQNNVWVTVPTGGGGSGGNDPRITNQQITNWDTSFGWGNHASQGYLTSVVLDGYATESWVGVNFQAKGSYLTASDLNGYATQTWVSQNYASQSYVSDNFQRKGNYEISGTAYTKAESDAKYELKGAGGGGGTDTFDDVCQRGSSTTSNPSAGNWYTLSDTYTVGGISGAGARYVSYDGKFVFYNKSNGKTVTLNTNGNVEGTSFTSWVNNAQLVTIYGNAIANSGSLGAGLYFSSSASAPSIVPCRGSDFAQTDNVTSLGNPQKRFTKVWAVNGAGALYRHTQNGNEAVLGVRDLIGVLEDLREATREEKTVDGLRDSIGNCVGGIVERLEAIQAETEKQVAAEIAMFEANEPDSMPSFTLEPTLPSVE